MRTLILLCLLLHIRAYDFTASPMYFDGMVIKQEAGSDTIGMMGIGQNLYLTTALKLGFPFPLSWSGGGSGSQEGGQFIHIRATTADNNGRVLMMHATIKDRSQVTSLSYNVLDNKSGKPGDEVIVIPAPQGSVKPSEEIPENPGK